MIQYLFSVPVSGPWWKVSWVWSKPKNKQVSTVCLEHNRATVYYAEKVFVFQIFNWAYVYGVDWR